MCLPQNHCTHSWLNFCPISRFWCHIIWSWTGYGSLIYLWFARRTTQEDSHHVFHKTKPHWSLKPSKRILPSFEKARCFLGGENLKIHLLKKVDRKSSLSPLASFNGLLGWQKWFEWSIGKLKARRKKEAGSLNARWKKKVALYF